MYFRAILKSRETILVPINAAEQAFLKFLTEWIEVLADQERPEQSWP